jgi:hypothetical protein
MKSEIVKINLDTNVNDTGMAIAAMMLARRACPDISANGYWFCFGEYESCGFQRKCSKFYSACSDFVRFAKNKRKNIEIFMNINRDIALRIV